MFDEFLPQFEEIVRISKKFEDAYNKEAAKGLHSISFGNLERHEENQKKCGVSKSLSEKLERILNSLDFETIKILQVIMYLGRDKDYNPSHSSEEIYEDYRRYFDNEKGWVTKQVEINQMTEKVPLGTYLENGFKILGIEF